MLDAEKLETEKPLIILPGKYAYREVLADYEITVTFQTKEEMEDYARNPWKRNKTS